MLDFTLTEDIFLTVIFLCRETVTGKHVLMMQDKEMFSMTSDQ